MLHQYLKINKKEHGVVVTYVEPLSSCSGILEPSDVLLSIDGVAIADDGTFEFRDTGERVQLSHLISTKFPGDKCVLKIKRNGITCEKK